LVTDQDCFRLLTERGIEAVLALVARRVLGHLALVVGLATAPGAAQEPPKNIKVTMVCILASEKPVHVDPKLVAIAKEIQKKKPELHCFKLKCMSCQSLPINKKAAFKLVDQQEVQVTIKQPADMNNHVILIIKPPLQGEIEYETVCGKFLPVITRYETANGERLILAVRVQPCNGGK
jgi:hypothetical protein